jgi:glycosyltransferase involved in cell wall biosynthesis
MNAMAREDLPRIAYVFPGGADRLGGAETQALGYFQHFDRSRFRLDFCLLGPSPVFVRACRAFPDVDIHVLSEVPRAPWHPLVLARYARLLRSRRYALVHLYGLRQEVFTRGLSRWWGGARVVSAIRGLESHRGRVARLLNRATAGAVDRWISNSEAARRVFAARDRLPLERILVVPSGVDPGAAPPRGEARRQARLRLGLPADRWLFGCVANHLPVKRLEDVVEALAVMRARNIDAEAVLAGQETEHTAAIRAAVDRLGLGGRVHFLGFREDVPAILRTLDALALASAHEGMPASLLEGMAAELPVVATSVGGVPELVRDRETGFLIDSGDVEALAARLAWLHDHREEARLMGERGRRRVEAEYSLKTMARRLDDIYAELLAVRGRATRGAA